MSCQQGQTAIAKKVAGPAGISQISSKTAGVVATSGRLDAGLTTGRPRSVRPATQTYQKLSLKKKETLWTAIGQAAMAGQEQTRQYRLNQAVREFGAGVVAAAVADDINKAKKENDDWALGRYRQLAEMLPTARQAAMAPSNTPAEEKIAPKGKGLRQARFFEQNSTEGKPEKLPTQYQINLARIFSDDELRQISTQLAFGGAATRRQLKLLSGGASRGIGHSDPRVLDWVTQDKNNFQFLSEQLAQARQRQDRVIDVASLTKSERVDLWEFSTFEADRALRNIDHLQSGWSHLKGPTAAYLTRV